ncbi:hypothetical protein HYN56_23795 [Flavobacterium crocinum]|uniref:Lipoprotein n=1 Tax=Flavobacterium crocinum TaxID=2183896 RepID=A0A2S1YSM4_9FLAO|nr:hypothetical protein [Flavobacterium crocinum]AWK07089.1 hypothetical protein HYN56_23795 [Flavobacterium crocinum]
MKKTISQIIAFTITALLLSCQRTIESDAELAAAVDSAAIVVDSIVATTTNKWEYHQSTDKMTSKAINFAQIMSNQSLDLEFPYEGTNYGRLTLRKKDGLDIYLSIDKGQITGGYDNNYISVRFDEEKPMKFSYTEPQDGSSDLIFIDNGVKFLSKLKKSKKILISLPLYQAGNQILEFNTVDLKW